MASQVVSIFRMPGLPVLLRPVPVASSPRIQYSHFRLQNFFGRAPPLHELSYGARRGTATFTLACSYGNGGGSGHSLQVLAAQTLSVLTSIQPFSIYYKCSLHLCCSLRCCGLCVAVPHAPHLL